MSVGMLRVQAVFLVHLWFCRCFQTDAALSAAHINALARYALNRTGAWPYYDVSLRLYAAFDEGAGTLVLDQSVNGNQGAIVGASSRSLVFVSNRLVPCLRFLSVSLQMSFFFSTSDLSIDGFVFSQARPPGSRPLAVRSALSCSPGPTHRCCSPSMPLTTHPALQEPLRPARRQPTCASFSTPCRRPLPACFTRSTWPPSTFAATQLRALFFVF